MYQKSAVVIAFSIVTTSAQPEPNVSGCPNRRSYATCFCNPDDHSIVGGGPRCGHLVNCPSDYADGCAVIDEEYNEERIALNLSLPYICMKATWVSNDVGDGEYVFEGHPDGQVAGDCVMPPEKVAEMIVCPWLELPAVVECQCHSEEKGYHSCGVLARCPMETLDLPDSSAKCLFFLDEGTGVMGGPPGRYYCHGGYGHGGIASIYPITHPRCCKQANLSFCDGTHFRKGQICEGEDDFCFTPMTTAAPPSSAERVRSTGVVFLLACMFQSLGQLM